MISLFRALCLAALLFPPVVDAQTPLASVSAVSDSLGLSYLSKDLDIFPPGVLTNALTLGDLRSASPTIGFEMVGVTSVGFGIRNRADSIEIDFGFDWNAGDEGARKITSDARIDELEIRWKGSDVRQFSATASRLLNALRMIPGTPACLEAGHDMSNATNLRRQREVAWFSNGWISKLYLLAVQDIGGQRFVALFRAFRLRPEQRAFYVPVKTGADCFPLLAGITDPFR